MTSCCPLSLTSIASGIRASSLHELWQATLLYAFIVDHLKLKTPFLMPTSSIYVGVITNNKHPNGQYTEVQCRFPSKVTRSTTVVQTCDCPRADEENMVHRLYMHKACTSISSLVGSHERVFMLTRLLPRMSACLDWKLFCAKAPKRTGPSRRLEGASDLEWPLTTRDFHIP